MSQLDSDQHERMSYREARKARLARLGAGPVALPVAKPQVPALPLAHDAGWGDMWFFDLIEINKEPRKIVPITEIQHAVCDYYGVSILDLLSQRRTRDINVPRQVAMYLCRTLTLSSFVQIGRRFGGRDHTTIIHGAYRIESRIGHDLELTCDVNALRRVLA